MLTRTINSWVRNGALVAVVMASVLGSRATALSKPSELPIVRSSVLQPNLRVPWSRPVRVVDPFEGESLAVFDQNYFSRSFRNTNNQVKIVSLWKPDSVSVLLAYSGRQCATARRSFPLYRQLYASKLRYHPFSYFYDDFPDTVCVVNNGTQKVTGLSIKAGDRIFKLESKNGQFVINPALATALKNAPEQTVLLRAIADNGEVIDSAIGRGTVRAWRSIY